MTSCSSSQKFLYAPVGQKHETDIVIIGAGPVGLFSIFECGIMDMKVHVVDALDVVGGQCAVLYPEKPIYDIPAWPEISGQSLVDRLVEQAAPFSPTVHLKQNVVSIEKDEEKNIFTVKTSGNTQIACKGIIIAAGVGAFGPNRPPLENIEDYEVLPEGSGVGYLVRKSDAYINKKIVIAGGGDSAVDWANALAKKSEKVYLVHRRSKFRAAPESIRQLEVLESQGKIEFITPYQLHSLKGNPKDGGLEGVMVQTLEGEERLLEADCMLAFYGLSMNLGPIAEWGLGIEKKHIKVNPATQETTQTGIYAIGDIATYEGKLKLILTGFSEAAQAAHQCYNLVYPGKAYHFEYSTTKGIPVKK